MLELAGDRFDMPEPAMDRLLRRRERRQRNERIAAAAVGLGVAAAGVVGAVVTLRVATGARPASEGGAAAPAESGGFVLSTVAVWTGIVVLGLVVLTAVRLRARGVDVRQEGRGPGGVAASARRPAAVPGTAPRKGGTEMDSRPKTEVSRIPSAEMPEIRFDDGKLRRTNKWLVAAVVLLAAAVVTLGAMLMASSGEEATQTGGTAVPASSNEWAVTIDELLATLSSGDVDTASQLYAEDAIMITSDEPGTTPYVDEGRDEIRDRLGSATDAAYGDWTLERASDVIGQGQLAGYLELYHGGLWNGMYGVTVFAFNEDGEIISQMTTATSP